MIARLLICPDIEKIKEEINQTFASHPEGVNVNHPDVLHFPAGSKLGIAEARKIKEHFSLKPYAAKGKMAVLEDAAVLTTEAQNALLKTLEELPQEALLILGANSTANFLPTILSRCKTINLKATSDDALEHHSKYSDDLKKLLNSSFEERFAYIEKLKNREEFLQVIISIFRQLMLQKIKKHDTAVLQFVTGLEIHIFVKRLLQTEEWAKQNVNIRAILEYLMLVMPSKI